MVSVKEIQKKGFYLPLVLTVTYLLASYLLYRFGCYVWPFRSDLLTTIFVVTCILLFSIGYIYAVKKHKEVKEYKNYIRDLPINTVLLICCIVALIIFIPTCKTYTNSWYPPIISMFLDPKETYYMLNEVITERTSIRVWAFLDVFAYVLLPLTLWAWEKIKKPIMCFAIFLSIGYMSIYISSAKNIALVVQMLSVVAVWLSSVCVALNDKNKRRPIIMTLIAGGYILLVAFFFQFTMSSRTGYDEDIYVALKEEITDDENLSLEEDLTNTVGGEINNEIGGGVADSTTENMASSGTNSEQLDESIEGGFLKDTVDTQRFEETAHAYNMADGQGVGVGTYQYNDLKVTEEQYMKFIEVFNVFPNYTDMWSKAYVNMNDIFVRMLPASLSNLYVVGTSYITNGYHTLTVALHTDHEWTYGVGHSMFLVSYIDKFFDTDLSNLTYYKRLINAEEYPLVSSSLWPSTFTQLADDFSFIGVVFFMAVIGYIVARIWISVIIQKNYWAVLLLGQVILGILFLPANNIIGNSGGFFVRFWTLAILWGLSQISLEKRAK